MNALIKKEMKSSLPLERTLKDKIFFFSSLALLVAAFAAVIYYIFGPSEGYFHSDCTDSLYWANASIEGGAIIADNFRYAALLPFSANLWMIPLIKIFGVGMTAQTVSMAIFTALYLASQIWLFRSLRFSWSFTFCSSAIMLMLLSSSVKMREIMWEHVIYYSLAIVFFNCLIALSIGLFKAFSRCRTQRDKRSGITLAIYAALLCLSSLCISTNGLAVIVMTTLPVCVGIAAEMFFDSKNKIVCKSNYSKLLSVGAIAVFSVLGFLVLQLLKGDVTADYTNFYSTFSSADSWSDNLFKFPVYFLTLIGFVDDSVSFASADGIVGLLAICVFAILILTPIIALIFYKKIKHTETKILLFSHASLFGVLLFIFVFGKISNASWRIVPLVGTSAIAVLCVINEFLLGHRESKNRSYTEKKKSPLRACALMLAVLSVFSVTTFVKIVKMPADYGRDNTLHTLTQTLEENGLEYGYATFWRSQAITVLSDSRVKCREILATREDGAKTDYYQSCFDWYEPQDGIDEYFVLLSSDEYQKVKLNSTWQRWEAEQLINKISVGNQYIIFVFSGYLEGIDK